MFKCELCGRECKSLSALSAHIKRAHDNKKKEYYDTFLKIDSNEGFCKICGKPTNFTGLRGYDKCCSRECINKYVALRTKEECMKRYGVPNPWSSKEIHNKCKQTMIDKYGGIGYAGKEVREKIEQTNLEKYGVRKTFQSKEVITKIEKTKEERYGNSKYNNREKCKKTNLDKYGEEAYNNRTKYHKTMKKKIDTFCKENDCTLVSSLNLEYALRSANALGITFLKFNDSFFVKNSDVDLIKTQNKKFKEVAKEYSSVYEIEIYTWLKEIYTGTIDTNVYNVIKDDTKKQLDFYLPEKKLAIEFNGDYWHSTLVRHDKNYHLNKTQLCQEKDIRLIHIFEHEWLSKKNICQSIISSALGIYENRRYARDCKIKEVDSKDARIFLENNHLQGYIPSSYRIGLYYNDELVQLLCFGKNRFKKDETELLRFCTKLNTQVVGGFSKLLKYQPYNTFISYVDLSKFSADSYLKNSFKIISQSGPNYKYIQGENILSRIAAQKHKLPKLLGDNFDEHKTESQNMIDNGWFQIYDCGNLKLEFCKGEK